MQVIWHQLHEELETARGSFESRLWRSLDLRKAGAGVAAATGLQLHPLTADGACRTSRTQARLGDSRKCTLNTSTQGLRDPPWLQACRSTPEIAGLEPWLLLQQLLKQHDQILSNKPDPNLGNEDRFARRWPHGVLQTRNTASCARAVLTQIQERLIAPNVANSVALLR